MLECICNSRWQLLLRKHARLQQKIAKNIAKILFQHRGALGGSQGAHQGMPVYSWCFNFSFSMFKHVFECQNVSATLAGSYFCENMQDYSEKQHKIQQKCFFSIEGAFGGLQGTHEGMPAYSWCLNFSFVIFEHFFLSARMHLQLSLVGIFAKICKIIAKNIAKFVSSQGRLGGLTRHT